MRKKEKNICEELKNITDAKSKKNIILDKLLTFKILVDKINDIHLKNELLKVVIRNILISDEEIAIKIYSLGFLKYQDLDNYRKGNASLPLRLYVRSKYTVLLFNSPKEKIFPQNIRTHL
ncbi:hypothetical protein ACFL56_03705 [Candidatus Margulisiibacteriota bacterium]